MKRIEEMLPNMYALMSQLNPIIPVTSKPKVVVNDTTVEMTTAVINPSVQIPIAKLDQILPESPAAIGGVQEGDLLLSFGPVNASSTPSPLNGIPDVVRQNVNQPINLVVRRGTVTVSLYITPKTWAGRGLLGCHLTPMQS